MTEYVPAELVLSPEGIVYFDNSVLASEQLPTREAEKIQELFSRSPAAGLLHLGVQEFNGPLPASFLFWQTFSRQLVTRVCKIPSEPEKLPAIPPPEKAELEGVVHQAFLLRGIEYLNAELLAEIWQSLIDCLRQELLEFKDLQAYLQHYNPRWNLVGRVCFHLAENKNNEERPFAFLATYTTQLSQRMSSGGAEAQHLPLKRALQELSGEKNHAALLALLLPVQKAAHQSTFIKDLVDSGAVFQALTWTAHEAHRFLQEIPLMEASGIMIRVPNWWNPQRPPRPKVVVKLGDKQNGMMGLNTLLDFDMHLALGSGEKLSREEWQSLLNATGNLVKIKGEWVEINREKLESVLSHWDQIQKGARNGLTMAESLRLLAGAGSLTHGDTVASTAAAEWSAVVAGSGLKNILDQLRNPQNAQEKSVEKILRGHLQGTLRPYQLAGVQWLWLLYQLKLGGCLADDMGLGKTIQVLSLFLMIKKEALKKKPHLLVVPASLLGNWQAEIDRFAPDLKVLIAHSSMTGGATLCDETDVVITTYGFVHRWEWLTEKEWDLVILDEAQLIKNPGTKQTTAVKGLKSEVRFALTGTPVENKIGDLWSLFDFTSPGLLGSSQVFSNYAKGAGKDFIASLKTLTQPYILRRLKSDKNIIADLPDKTEMQTYCTLSKEQIRLYQQALKELAEQLEIADGIKRRGLVLSYLIRFKQICNHPVQCTGFGEYAKEASGKFIRLAEICEEIRAKQEKVLVFTQFREIIPALSALLTEVFGREGLELHGETPIKKRAELVENFQQQGQSSPFFILSLRAGGTGLNLTRASHVIHFDRWWNPAVENQATDRAYRIGQKHPVLVHKFICRGTIEEKIDELIASKKNLSQELLGSGNEIALTELTNEELIDMLSLDIHRSLGEI